MKNKKMVFAVVAVLTICILGGLAFAAVKNMSGNTEQKSAAKAVRKYCKKYMSELADDDSAYFFNKNVVVEGDESGDAKAQFIITDEVREISELLDFNGWTELLSEQKFTNVEQVFILYMIETSYDYTDDNYDKQLVSLYRSKEKELCRAAKERIIIWAAGMADHSEMWDNLAIKLVSENDSYEESMEYYYYIYYVSDEFQKGIIEEAAKHIENQDKYSDAKLCADATILLNGSDELSDETVDKLYDIFERESDTLLEKENDFDLHSIILHRIISVENTQNVDFFIDFLKKCEQKPDEYTDKIMDYLKENISPLFLSISKKLDDDLSVEEINSFIHFYNRIYGECSEEILQYTQEERTIFRQKIDMFRQAHPDDTFEEIVE